MEVKKILHAITTLCAKRGLQGFVFALLLALLVLNRTLVLFNANQMVDSDQPFMWLGTRDYAEGKFYEPRFYGQDYNTFIEALVAAPLYKAGVPIYYAVPLATHFLFLFPLLFSLLYLFRKGLRIQAILGASLLLCFSTAFDILSSLPRGFVGGLFFCSFLLPSAFAPNYLRLVVLNCILLVFGFFITPNLVLAAAPYATYIFLHNFKNKKFYLLSIPVGITYVLCYFLFDYFYKIHPEYVVYNLVNDFSLTYFIQNISNLDQCFAHVSLFVEDNSLPLLAAFAVLTVVCYKANKLVFVTWLSFLFVLVFSFFAGKTRDGSFWPYYSYSRMYLAIPLVFIFFIALLPLRNFGVMVIPVLIALAFESYKLSKAEAVKNYHTNHLHAKGVRIYSVATIEDALKTYKKFCNDNGVRELKISTIFWLSPYLTYGAQVIDPTFPNTEETWADRRYWVRLQHEDSLYSKFMIISINSNFDTITRGKHPFEVKRLDDYGAFLIYNNRLKNKAFMDILRDIED